ncbi:ArsR family transcriptional regulator [Roseibium denhamense]|uniref:DNA-binding transcriptional regulator, ArsR family n=1 Tax=Roseibium denhamense TaxID=76305 RepID=A0ABY1NV21_9HYPH|nr:metalloregulator ArsR/SmtB family transcription factor [Roseibium denhamense]MTI05473.1 ArsR family transcriptional regulator [Roseibium denhamense]SMP18405.1 DNA-binding transcriptional regulator, ArsR family [Roseibium denhamense]
MTETVVSSSSAPPSETASMCDGLASIFRALGHPARLAIIQKLAAEEQACCGAIVDALPLAQSTVSQHLQVLKDAGLLTCVTRGRNCHYCLNWDKMAEAEQSAQSFWKRLDQARVNIEQLPDFKTHAKTK